MNLLFILAQTQRVAEQTDYAQVEYGSRYVLQILDQIWQQVTSLDPLQAVIAVAFGVIPLMYGWRIYKVLTVIGFGMLGLYIGMRVGLYFDDVLLGSVIGACMLTVAALPLMKWAVCILGAVAGGLLTAGMWYALHLPEQFVWAGSLVGLVAGGMLSFVVFRLAVMLFSSFAGACLIIVGAFGLIYRFETYVQDPPTTNLNNAFYNHQWFLPLLLIAGTGIGILMQLRFIKKSKEYNV